MVESFFKFLIEHLPFSFSDHCPLLVHTDNSENDFSKHHFKFEAWYVLEDSCKDVIHNVWMTSNGDVLAKLKALQYALIKWSKSVRKKEGYIQEVGRQIGGTN